MVLLVQGSLKTFSGGTDSMVSRGVPSQGRRPAWSPMGAHACWVRKLHRTVKSADPALILVTKANSSNQGRVALHGTVPKVRLRSRLPVSS